MSSISSNHFFLIKSGASDQGGKIKRIVNFNDCIFNNMISPTGIQDIAIDDLVSKTSACPISTYCDFESPDLCGFYNSPMAIFNWTQFRGASPSFLTGPPYDHVDRKFLLSKL